MGGFTENDIEKMESAGDIQSLIRELNSCSNKQAQVNSCQKHSAAPLDPSPPEATPAQVVTEGQLIHTQQLPNPLKRKLEHTAHELQHATASELQHAAASEGP